MTARKYRKVYGPRARNQHFKKKSERAKNGASPAIIRPGTRFCFSLRERHAKKKAAEYRELSKRFRGFSWSFLLVALLVIFFFVSSFSCAAPARGDRTFHPSALHEEAAVPLSIYV